MRRIPTDQNGKPVTPPAITPLLNSRVIDECRTEVVTQTRSYELITPLFGGGSEPGKADSDMVIRGSGIRGQLRFWWRACRGGGFNGDLGAMKKAEDRLWGARSKPGEPRPSKVQVCVKVTEVGNRLQPFEIKPRGVKKSPCRECSREWYSSVCSVSVAAKRRGCKTLRYQDYNSSSVG